MIGFTIQNLLQRLDIFGLSVSFRVFKEKSHKTIFGGIVTLCIWTIILYQFISLTKFVYDQESPSIIQQINYVKQPEFFQFKPNTFTFAFGLEDPLGKHFKDESLYFIKAFMYNNQRVINATTGAYDNNSQIVEVKIVNCTKEHFQIEGTQEYFYTLPLDKLYCFDLNESNIGIEGEFSALIYKQFNIQILECDQPSCADPTIRAQKLASTRLGIYTSDNLIQVTNRDKPYMSIGRNMFWVTGSGLQKEIRFQLINNYINTDIGIMEKNIQIERVVSFSSERELVLNRQSSLMYNFFFNYEKNKEIIYQRKYMKLDQAFSQIGGTFNVLISIGCLLCWPISQLELNRKIINSVFSVDEDDLDQKNQEKQQSEKNITNEMTNISQKITKLLKNNNNNNAANNTQSTPILKSCSNPKGESENQMYIKQFFKYSFSELKIRFCDYFSAYFGYCKKGSAKKEIIKLGTNILYNHIDILNVVNKLVEIDKLKHLLLNENQIKLFEYIPKPQLKLSQLQKVSDDSDIFEQKSKNQFMIDSFLSNQQSAVNIQSSNKNDFGLYFTPQKTVKQKTEEAYLAFNNIQNQQLKMSEIDKKLVQMVDQRLVNLFLDNDKKLSLNKSVCIKDQSTYHLIDTPLNIKDRLQPNHVAKNQQPQSVNNLNISFQKNEKDTIIIDEQDLSEYLEREEEKDIHQIKTNQYMHKSIQSLNQIKNKTFEKYHTPNFN